jgi:hypothetical protein
VVEEFKYLNFRRTHRSFCERALVSLFETFGYSQILVSYLVKARIVERPFRILMRIGHNRHDRPVFSFPDQHHILFAYGFRGEGIHPWPLL